MRANPALIVGAKEFYRTRPVEFINHWCDTYDPRNAGHGKPPRMPFILFKRQAEFVEFVHQCIADEESGLAEKARDVGLTWTCCALSVHLWLFWHGSSVGWGSRKEQLVDKIGDPDSIFEKMRMLVRGIPREFWPRGFRPDDHMTYMKFINPESGATITGEAGDNIGRGGRKLIYFKDESAHYERPEKIEAALADNTRVQMDVSSVNGTGNVFYRRREAGIDWSPGVEMPKGRTRVFVVDWRDHPAKTDDWYETRRQKMESEGLLHVFAQEVDRNYSAAVDGIIIPAEWVKAAIDAHKAVWFDGGGMWCGALDVADEGGDLSALALRKGVVLKSIAEWGDRDTGKTTRLAVDACAGLGAIELQYDSVGVGAGVKAEANRLAEEGKLPKGVRLVPWNAGAAVLFPDKHVIEGDKDSPLNQDFYKNLKAQGWWQLRRRFEKTYRAVKEGIKFPHDELISLDSACIPVGLLRKLEKELSQPTASRNSEMKLIVDKAPEGTRSPNLGDAVMMAFWPIPTKKPLLVSDDILARAQQRPAR